MGKKKKKHYEEETVLQGKILSYCKINITKKKIEQFMIREQNMLTKENQKQLDTNERLKIYLEDIHLEEKDKKRFQLAALLEAYNAGRARASRMFMAKSKERREYIWIQQESEIKKGKNGNVFAIFRCKDITKEYINQVCIDAILQYDYDFVGLIFRKNKQFCFLAEDVEIAKFQPETYDYDTAIQQTFEKAVVAKDVASLIASAQVEEVCRQLEKKSAYTVEVDMRNYEGVICRKQIRYSYVDRKLGILCVTRADTTEVAKAEKKKQQQLEAALQMAERANAAKSAFLATVSHEIRTPLNVIIGMTQIAKKEDQDIALLKDCLKKIENSGKHLLSLVNDVLDMSKIESGELVLYPEVYTYDEFREKIESIIIPGCEQKNITFIEKGNATHHPIITDSMRFNQIMLNLLSNAIKYTPEGGEIQFRYDNKIKNQKMYCDFCVQDNGIGMSKEFLSKVFLPFAQERTEHTKSIQGTGLGLPIAKAIVDKMGGSIHVVSEKGKGTTFYVHLTFPLADAKEEPVFVKEQRADLLKGKKILIVEDYELNAMILEKILENKQADVIIASNGKEAIDMFDESEVGEISAILMDVRMPVMNGLEATRQIRMKERLDAMTVPIFAMTANAYAGDRRKSMQAGMNEHLSKPVDVEVLYQMLDRYVNEK